MSYKQRLLEELGLWSFYIFILLLITFQALGVQVVPYLGYSAYAAENETLETRCPQDGTCSTFGYEPYPVWQLIALILACVALAAFLLLFVLPKMPEVKARMEGQ